MMRALVLLIALIAGAAPAEEVVLGLSQDRVAITANFDGSEVLIFGAVKREAAIPEGELQVIITLAGPSLPVTVRRKERVFGIWMNTDAVKVDSAPAFYAVASSAPLSEALSATEDLRYGITIPRVIRSVGAEVDDSDNFSDALVRIRAGDDLYQVREGGVDMEQSTLFRGQITLPSALTEGDYVARIFLTRGGKVVDEYRTIIPVNKVGLERWLFDLSREQPLIYGLLTLAIAISAGWLASAAFRAFQR